MIANTAWQAAASMAVVVFERSRRNAPRQYAYCPPCAAWAPLGHRHADV